MLQRFLFCANFNKKAPAFGEVRGPDKTKLKNGIAILKSALLTGRKNTIPDNGPGVILIFFLSLQAFPCHKAC